jgi:hypothetical protein
MARRPLVDYSESPRLLNLGKIPFPWLKFRIQFLAGTRRRKDENFTSLSTQAIATSIEKPPNLVSGHDVIQNYILSFGRWLLRSELHLCPWRFIFDRSD